MSGRFVIEDNEISHEAQNQINNLRARHVTNVTTTNNNVPFSPDQPQCHSKHSTTNLTTWVFTIIPTEYLIITPKWL